MRYTYAKEKVEALLSEAKAKLVALGVEADMEVELAENELGAGEFEVMKVFGSIGVKTPELTEDEVFYLSVDLDVYEDEINESDYESATGEFTEALAELISRLESEENKSEAIRTLGHEIDEELERAQREELERTDRATKRDLKVAVIALAALVFVALAFMLISKLAG